jgi:hypothetical protein
MKSSQFSREFAGVSFTLAVVASAANARIPEGTQPDVRIVSASASGGIQAICQGAGPTFFVDARVEDDQVTSVVLDESGFRLPASRSRPLEMRRSTRSPTSVRASWRPLSRVRGKSCPRPRVSITSRPT